MGTLSRFIRIALPLSLLLAAAIVVPLKVFDHKGLPRVRRLSAELEIVQAENLQIRRENDNLRCEIHAFHEDPNYVERVARDELGMVGPGELIYQFPDKRR